MNHSEIKILLFISLFQQFMIFHSFLLIFCPLDPDSWIRRFLADPDPGSKIVNLIQLPTAVPVLI